MTIVALQKQNITGAYGNADYQILRVVADSRLSSSSGHGTLTDLAPKIMPIEMRSGQGTGHMSRFAPYGFAFAGSSLAASLTHFTAQFLLTNLFSNNAFSPPTVGEVTNVYRDVGLLHMSQLSTVFSAVVFGKQVGGDAGFKAFSLEPRIDEALHFDRTEICNGDEIYRVGSGSVHFDGIVQKRQSEGASVECFSVIEEMIQAQVHHSVGGFIQSGFIDEQGFHQDNVIQAPESGNLEIVTYLGVDLASVSRPDGYKYGRTAVVVGTPGEEVPEFIHTTQ